MQPRSSWKRLGGIVMGTLILVGCATASVPPSRMVEQNDHARLAAWYQQEAATLRDKAEEMKKMATSYEERMSKPGQSSALVQHCRNLVNKYTTAAESADALAQLHKEQETNR